MTIDYSEKESSKKKYLAPLVVIMLCLVALTGAAYAYSTTVTGNGDINGEYTIIDIYETGTGKYEATSNFDIVNNAIQFYTVTNKTGTENSYTAFIDEDNYKLVYKTYLRINTSSPSGTYKPFHLEWCKGTYTAPKECGDLQVNGVDSGTQFSITEVGLYTDATKTDPADKADLKDNTLYYAELTLYVSTPEGGFCTKESMDEVTKKINSYNNTKNELSIMITAGPGRL